MEDIIITIKKVFSLLCMVALFSCKTSKLPEVGTKLAPVFKEHEKMYKKQNVWKHVRWEYKYGRQVIDSIFTRYNLHDSDEFYIITSTGHLANYSLEIKSIDRNIQLKFNGGYKKIFLLDNSIEMSYSGDFKDYGEVNFYDFVNIKTQEELENCHKYAPTINSRMILFTYYNKGDITVKRFVTCDYAEYFNMET